MHLRPIISTIKERRATLGITQEQTAELAGIGLRTLKAIESGTSNPTVKTLSRIADVLGMNLVIALEVKKMNG